MICSENIASVLPDEHSFYFLIILISVHIGNECGKVGNKTKQKNPWVNLKAPGIQS